MATDDLTNTGGVGAPAPVNDTPYSYSRTNDNPEHIQENEDIEMQPLKGRGLITEKEKSTAKNEDSDHKFFRILIVAYISSWVGFCLLVHHNKEAKDLSSVPSIIITVEIVKLAFASVLFCKSSGGAGELMHFFRDHEQFLKEMKRYFPIAALYAICNNLMMFNLKNNNPIVYQILKGSRLLMVAVVWQIFFQTQIPKKRKVALVLITIGLMIKCFEQNGDAGVKDVHMEKSWWEALFGFSLVLLEMACGVMASVYNEKMLKQVKCDQYLQNICLYLNSIVINAAIFLVPTDTNGGGQEASLLSKTSVMIVIALAAGGLMTAMMIRAAGSVTKCVVAASITIVTCVIDVAFFNYKLVTPEAVAVTLVTLGSAIYSLH